MPELSTRHTHRGTSLTQRILEQPGQSAIYIGSMLMGYVFSQMTPDALAVRGAIRGSIYGGALGRRNLASVGRGALVGAILNPIERYTEVHFRLELNQPFAVAIHALVCSAITKAAGGSFVGGAVFGAIEELLLAWPLRRL